MRDSVISLFVANTDGSNSVKLTNPIKGTFISSPRWSADGKQIMYISGFSLYVINTDGTNSRNIQIGDDTVEYFDWISK
jgi:Tol biopolymer transport system component